MQYATDRQAAVQQQRGLSSLSCTFVHGSCFDLTVMAALGRFDRIHVGGSCPKPRLRDLLKLLKPGEDQSVPTLSMRSLLCTWHVVSVGPSDVGKLFWERCCCVPQQQHRCPHHLLQVARWLSTARGAPAAALKPHHDSVISAPSFTWQNGCPLQGELLLLLLLRRLTLTKGTSLCMPCPLQVAR